MASVIWYFDPHGILTLGSIFIHGILTFHGILNLLISNQEIGRGGQNTMGRGFSILWVEGQNTMDRGFDISWVEGSKYHG